MKKILLVDDEPNNLQLLRQILSPHYALLFATNGEKAIEATVKHLPDLILLDIMMPEMSGYDVCMQLKANQLTANIPVIFVTAMNEIQDEAKGFDVGAVDYISKPISSEVVLRRVETHLSLVRVQDLERSYKEAIAMLGEAGHYNDEDTGLHIWRMSAYSRELAEAAGWSKKEADILELAAPMHDTGKIGIPDHILKAPRKLTVEEWNVMKTHCQIGYNILSMSKSPVFVVAAEIALGHHEKWDGSGYPNQLVGEEIPESARIVAIADVFDALTCKRPYKQPWTVEASIAEMRKSAGTQFDPNLLELFFDLMPKIIALKHEWPDNTVELAMANPACTESEDQRKAEVAQ